MAETIRSSDKTLDVGADCHAARTLEPAILPPTASDARFGQMRCARSVKLVC